MGRLLHPQRVSRRDRQHGEMLEHAFDRDGRLHNYLVHMDKVLRGVTCDPTGRLLNELKSIYDGLPRRPGCNSPWAAPIGIPTPNFGGAIGVPMDAVSPTRPSDATWDAGWSATVPFADTNATWYYVAPQALGATDTLNVAGSPSHPRKTIPLSLNSSTNSKPLVVELHGNYTNPISGNGYRHVAGSDGALNCTGTAAWPIWIRGFDSLSRPILSRRWNFVTASYVMIEQVNWNRLLTDEALFTMDTTHAADHVCLRHADLTVTDPTTVLLNQGVCALGSSISHTFIVYYDVAIHDYGVLDAVADVDANPFHFADNANHVWIMDCVVNGSIGAGLQLKALKANRNTLNNIFVGRCSVTQARAAGLATKYAEDVVFSQNHLSAILRWFDPVAKTSSLGKGLGNQYDTWRYWALFNLIDGGCDAGLSLQGLDGSGGGLGPYYFLGNIIRDQADQSPTRGGPVWSATTTSLNDMAPIMLRSDNPSTEIHVLHNSLYHNQGHVRFGEHHLTFEQNIVGKPIGTNARHILTAHGTDAASWTSCEHNVYEPSFTARLATEDAGGTDVASFAAWRSTTSRDSAVVSSVEAAPSWTNAAAGDFTLTAGAPAIGLGGAATPAAYTAFAAQAYGGSTAQVDYAGSARPIGGTWDAGALESGSASSDVTPPTVVITDPVSDPTFATSTTPVAIGGTSNDDVAVVSVTWANDRGGSGTVSGTINFFLFSGVALAPGANLITVTAHDAAGNIGTDSITVTYTPPVAPTLLGRITDASTWASKVVASNPTARRRT